jgi:hypothetical protein
MLMVARDQHAALTALDDIEPLASKARTPYGCEAVDEVLCPGKDPLSVSGAAAVQRLSSRSSSLRNSRRKRRWVGSSPEAGFALADILEFVPSHLEEFRRIARGVPVLESRAA